MRCIRIDALNEQLSEGFDAAGKCGGGDTFIF